MLPMSIYLDTVQASTSGDLGIISSAPEDNSIIPSYESVFFGVTIKNFHSQISPSRIIHWDVCLGNRAANSCISNSIDNGQISIPSIQSGAISYFESNTYFNPSGLNETITVVYQFDQFDINPSNDMMAFTLHPSLEFSDLKIDNEQNIFSSLNNLNYVENKPILNPNVGYMLTFSSYANVCPTCQLNITFGWELWNEQHSQKINQSYDNLSSFPKFSYYKQFDTNLPEIRIPYEGNFILKIGFFNSTGNPFDDLIEQNNVAEYDIIVDNSIDIALMTMKPRNTGASNEYLYGTDMVEVSLENIGNVTVENVTINLEVISYEGVTTYSSTCLINIMFPNDLFGCQLDLLTYGDSLTIRTTVISEFENGVDINPNNNIIEKITSINVSALSAYIIFEDPQEWYTDQDIVNVSGFSNLFAPGPVSHSWWYAGFINIGNENTVSITTSEYGLGEHIFRYTVTDIFGNTESIYFSIYVYYEIVWDNYPYSSATGVTPNAASISHSNELPTVDESYGIGNGNSPLLILNYDLTDESGVSMFTGTNWLDITINYSEILPSYIPRESVEIRKLESPLSTSWEFFDSNNLSIDTQKNNILLRIFESTTILLIGELSTPDVEAFKFNASAISEGRFSLTWEPSGEIENQYLQGWSIYKKIVSINGGTIFPPTTEDFNPVIWDDLTSNTFIEMVPINSNQWIDETYLDSNFCASYAIAPTDRIGVTHYEIANVTTNLLGEAAFVCGDSTPPSSTVINFQHQSIFTNSTDCYMIENDWSMCYEVELTWEWPTLNEQNVTWNLYRIENNPNGIDLKLATPIVSGMTNIAGQQSNYTDSGIEDDNLKPMRTYFYVLTPIDNVGNERTIVLHSENYPSPNVEEVHILDSWWAYNQHLIPEPEPEPEPPLNNEWLGNFSDSLDQQEFQTAGIVTLVTLCLGVIMLAFISKRLKRLRRVVSARNRRLAESMANEFEDFYE